TLHTVYLCLIPRPSRSRLFPYTTLFRSIRDLSELSVFNRELDLHAEKLFDDPKSVLPEVILQKQIKTFVWFMDKAKSMNIDRVRSEEHTSELQSRENLVCRLLLEKKKSQ